MILWVYSENFDCSPILFGSDIKEDIAWTGSRASSVLFFQLTSINRLIEIGYIVYRYGLSKGSVFLDYLRAKTSRSIKMRQ